MAVSPKFKVFRDGEYVASCKYAEDAAAILACSGDNACVKVKGHVVYREAGISGQSYDEAARLIRLGEQQMHRKVYDKQQARIAAYGAKAALNRTQAEAT